MNERLGLGRMVALAVAALALTIPRPASAEWTEPRPLSVAGGDARSPAAALGDDGRLAVVWMRRMGDGTTVDIEGVFGTLGGDVGPVVTMSHVPGAGADPPEVAIGPNGRAMVVWEQGAVRAMEIAPGASTGPVTTLSTRQPQHAYPTAHFDRTGNATVFWRRNDDGYFDGVAVNTRPAGGAWTGEREALAMTPGRFTRHAAAASGDGAAVVVAAGYDDVYMSTRSQAGDGFSARTLLNVPDAVESVRGVDAAMDRAGNALVVWEEIPDAARHVRARFRPAGGGFGPVMDVAGSAITPEEAAL